MDVMSMKDEWRYVKKRIGRQYVMQAGAEKRHRFFVGSWDTKEIWKKVNTATQFYTTTDNFSHCNT